MSKKTNEQMQEDFLKETENEKRLPGGNKIDLNVSGEQFSDPRILKIGRYKIDRTYMPYGGLYPKSWQFEIRAALGKEISYFSTIDTEDPLSVFDGMNKICESCVFITDTEKKIRIPSSKINEMDRVWFVLKVRDLTIPERENKIVLHEKCKYCGAEQDIEISSDTIIEKPMSEFAKKYWNEETGKFEFKTSSYGIITILPSTIELARIFMDYMQTVDKENNDDFFIKRFNLFVDESDLRVPSECAKNAYNRFIATVNEPKKFALYQKIEKELELGLDDKLCHVCNSCGKELHIPVRFPNGLENIFNTTDIDTEFI